MKRSLRALAVIALLVMVFSLFEVNLALAEANKVYFDLSLRTEEELNASMMTVTAGKTKMYDENNEVICTLTKDEIVYFVSMDGDFCHGSRMNGPHNFFEVVVIIGTMASSSSNRHLIIHGLEDIQYDMTDNSEVLRGMISSHSGRIFPECDVQTPMERALHPPMAPC